MGPLWAWRASALHRCIQLGIITRSGDPKKPPSHGNSSSSSSKLPEADPTQNNETDPKTDRDPRKRGKEDTNQRHKLRFHEGDLQRFAFPLNLTVDSKTTLVQEGHSLRTNHSSTRVRSTVGDPAWDEKDQRVETKREDF